MKETIRSPLAHNLGLAALAATAIAAAQPARATDAEFGLTACRFDHFSVEIVRGPSSGLTLEGELWVVEEIATHRISGALETSAGAVLFTGRYAPAGRIAVAFHLGEQTVVGEGPIAGELCGAEAPIEGMAMGPTIAGDFTVEGTDFGHWLLESPNAVYLLEPADETVTTSDARIITKTACTQCGGTIKNGACTSNDPSVSQCISGAAYTTTDTIANILRYIGFLKS